MNEKWFSLSIAQTEKKLKTNAASGLNRRAARSAWYKNNRISRDGNRLFIRKKKNISKMLIEIISDFALIILLFAAVFALLFEERLIGLTVLGILCISLAVSFVFYLRSQRTMEQMNLYFSPTAKVIRGGRLYSVAFENIVAGDVILVEQGDIIPADARLVTSDNLSVAMRVDAKKYIPLQKQAQGVVSENENNPAKWVNILHAGSIVESGSARAIVYATGAYTYLGAISGGIPEFYSDNIPTELKKMKKICSQISLYSMLCILPFSILSLVLSHMSGGTSTLSVAFLTALSISASSMTQLSCTICKVFFVKKISDILKSENTAVIRTTDAFDKLGNISCLFMLDGCAITDGILHFDAAFNSEGDIKNFDNPNASARMLFEMASLYNSAESNMLTLGVNLPDRFKVGLEEFLSRTNTDAEALKIRCPIKSYMSGSTAVPTDRVFYSDRGRSMLLDISRTDDIFSQCTHTIMSGKILPLTSVGTDKLKHTYNVHTSKGKTVLVFSVSPCNATGNTGERIFAGAIVLREGVDKNALSAVEALEKNGIKVISFVSNGNSINVPQIPVELHRNACATKDDFSRAQLPLTYKFGELDTYYDFEEKDILTLLRLARSQGTGVGVIAFSDSMPSVIEQSDVFISCAPAVSPVSAKNEDELYKLELCGTASSASCTQTVKAEADVLIPRPKSNGGIRVFAKILAGVQTAYRNLSSFFKYMLCAQLIRILTVGIPMAVGAPILDARHVLFCSFIVDIFVLLMLANDKTPLPHNSISKYKIVSLKQQLTDAKRLVLCTAIASFACILLPMLMDTVGIFGNYLYKSEYLFSSMLYMHLILAYYIRFGSVFAAKAFLKNKIFISLVVGVILFLSISMIIAPVGLIFDLVENPLPYFIASFIPTVVFALLMEFLPTGKKNK